MVAKVRIELEEIEGFMRIKVKTDLNDCTFQEKMLAEIMQHDLQALIQEQQQIEEVVVH
ncbi:MAG: hypothetical protein VW620_09980 [Rhodospirillales bacterium]